MPSQYDKDVLSRYDCQISGVREDLIALAKRTASDLREDALWGALSICKGQGKRKGKGKGIARKGTGIAHKGKGKVHGKQALD